MDYLLYNRRSYITGRALATQLGLRYLRSSNKLVRLNKPPKIRYGNSEHNFGKKDTNMNHPENIRLCANSYQFSRWCKENNYLTPYYAKFSMNNIPEYPFLLRRLHHMRGRDIILIEKEADITRISRENLANRYWVPFYLTTFELRVHIINEEVVKVFKKVKEGALADGEFIRTSSKNWHYSIRTKLDDKYIKAQELCINLMKDLGLFFGGIDIAWNNNNKQYIVWEVNTAPGLSSPTLRLYADKLRRYL